MVKIADLHIHSIFSDGRLAPNEIFEKAQDKGLSAISITDHDTVDGNVIANKIKKNYNVEFINGIELSTYDNDKEYHLLGYMIDISNEALISHLAEYRMARLKRAEKILEKLNQFNISLDIESLLKKAGEAPITRPHIASMLLDEGYITTLKEAFHLYIGEGKPAFEQKLRFPIDKAIRLVNDCGGVAVLAHPGNHVTQSQLYKFIKMGLDGVEVVHAIHDERMKHYYHSIANQYWLLETGGSDYHGNYDYDELNFGKYTISYSNVESIKVRSGKK
jgi:3',5'-nucleoside bisphosphate phosphatase